MSKNNVIETLQCLVSGLTVPERDWPDPHLQDPLPPLVRKHFTQTHSLTHAQFSVNTM